MQYVLKHILHILADFFMHVCNLGFTVYTMSHLGLIGTSLGHAKPQWIPKFQPFHTQLFHDHLP